MKILVDIFAEHYDRIVAQLQRESRLYAILMCGERAHAARKEEISLVGASRVVRSGGVPIGEVASGGKLACLCRWYRSVGLHAAPMRVLRLLFY